jgi:hypothetical protein
VTNEEREVMRALVDVLENATWSCGACDRHAGKGHYAGCVVLVAKELLSQPDQAKPCGQAEGL